MALDLKTATFEIEKREKGDEILNKLVNHPEYSKIFKELILKVSND